MKRKLLIISIIAFIGLIFTNYNLVLTSTIKATDIWLNKVFPYLFIMIILNELLINLDFAHLFKNASHYIFIMSLLSGSPTSAYIINSLYQENYLTKNNANLNLLFTYFSNPLFLVTILTSIFHNQTITFKLIIIHYLSNIIIYILYKKQLEPIKFKPSNPHFNLSLAIKKGINTTSMVLGAIVFYLVLSNILIHILKLSLFKSLMIRGILEVTQGLNYLAEIKLSTKIKEMISIFFISFGGLSIHTQIKCILDESNLDYKYFLKGRIMGSIIALILTAYT